MKTVAFLQNSWFKNPARAAAIYASHSGDWDRRAKLNAAYLFFGSLTGRRLMQTFGDQGRISIVWEEASPRVAGQSDGVFPADWPHMLAVLEHHQPEIVLGFGSIAVPPLRRMREAGAPWHFIQGPHPAARHATVASELAAMAETWRRLIDVAVTGGAA